jgi:hypothetical protein
VGEVNPNRRGGEEGWVRNLDSLVPSVGWGLWQRMVALLAWYLKRVNEKDISNFKVPKIEFTMYICKIS